MRVTILSQTELYCVHSRGLCENRTRGTSVTGMYVSHYTNRPLVAGTGFEPVSLGYEPNGVTTPPTRDVYSHGESNSDFMDENHRS